MIRRLAAITLWLLAGNAAAAGLFWWLIHVPESSGLTLAFSGVLVLAIALVLLVVHGGALAAWQPDATWQSVRNVRRTMPAAAVGALLFLAVWWLTRQATDWHMAYAGQIDAWIIAGSGRSGTAWLHRGIDWTIWAARWGLGLTLALSLAAWTTGAGVRAVAGTGWMASAVRPARWIAVGVLVGVTVVLPWHWAYWRPAHLSLALEPWFVVAKLAAMGIVAALGWALVLRVAGRRP